MRVPRDLKEALPRIRAAVADLATEKGRMPDAEEVADATNMEESEVREALEASRAARPASLDAPASARLAEEGAIPLVEQVGVRDEHLDQVEYNVILDRAAEAAHGSGPRGPAPELRRGPDPERDRRAHRRLADAGLADHPERARAPPGGRGRDRLN